MRRKSTNAAPLHFLIIAHGESLSAKRLRALSRGHFVICLDGASNDLHKLKIRPHLILGDMDGINPKVRNKFIKLGVPILTYGDQETTDLEKALLYCRVRRAQSIRIASALGKRTDHTIANLSFLKKYARKGCDVALFTETECIRFIQDSKVTLGKKGKTVSVFGFSKAIVSSQGLEYEMKALPLAMGKRESVSNRTKSAKAKISIKGKALVVLEE